MISVHAFTRAMASCRGKAFRRGGRHGDPPLPRQVPHVHRFGLFGRRARARVDNRSPGEGGAPHEGGTKKVVCAPPKDFLPIKIVGVNQKECKISDTAVSNASSLEVVSIDGVSCKASSLFDIGAGVALNGNFVKLTTLCDKKWGYSNR